MSHVAVIENGLTARMGVVRAQMRVADHPYYTSIRLSTTTRRLLSEDGAKAASRSRVIRPGTVLILEWHSVAHQVTVGEDGVLYRGECYRSLSEVARLITGARWSGPRFFGLKT